MNRLLVTLLTVVTGAGLLSASASAQDPVGNLRISIAISGGASKGAYEAGLNWAALKLARESENLSSPSGGQLRPVELASIAGASAGGINSILSGLIWCSLPEAEGGIASRIDSNVFRDSWLRVDINALLPPQPDSEIYLPDDAVFSRRDYLDSAADLQEKWHRKAYRVGCRVPLGVTVTRVEPQELTIGGIEVKNQRFYIPFELQVQEDGTVAYFFDPAEYPGLFDPAMILMPRPRNEPEFSISDENIIKAAVTTSAFPNAFGRVRLQFCRLQLQSDSISQEPGSEQSDTDMVCPDGYLLDEAEFADGGLFDNLPLGLARILAESNIRASKNPLPVTYVYLDPNRVSYETPEPVDNTACAQDDPPAACRTMDFSFSSESKMLLGAMGTARKTELYRETVSENWRRNLSTLAYELAQNIAVEHSDFDCREELPYFGEPVTCAEALHRAGQFLEIAYDRIKPVILPPYSVEHLVEAGIAHDCQRSSKHSDSEPRVECNLNIKHYRNQLADALISVIERGNMDYKKLAATIERARASVHDDRILRVSSRGAPITGTLLHSFASFLDYKFREYDYYVGIYDAIVMVSKNLCRLHYSEQQSEEFRRCVNQSGKQYYDVMGVEEYPRARYVFARIAEKELAGEGLFKFAYSPSPPVDRDMQIIHDGLAAALEKGRKIAGEDRGAFATENIFFEYLKAESFVPSKTEDGVESLLAQIIDDPSTWGTELTRRVSARLVYLEQEAARIYAEREPNPELREESYTLLMGTAAHFMRSANYKYPDFTFSPSTAPEDWAWRYVIPYELGLDLVQGNALFTWQPTMALSTNNLVNLRATLRFEGGLLDSDPDQSRGNYIDLGLGYTRLTESTTISSYGIVPTWYHSWKEPTTGDQDTVGGEVFMAFLKDRLRVSLGTRDFSNASDNWFLTLSLTDLPGMTYWLTR